MERKAAYDDPSVEFTNNPKERRFAECKGHFRALYGRINVGRAFRAHGIHYTRLRDGEWDEASVKEVLLVAEVAVVAEGVRALYAHYATTHSQWQILEHNTGDWERLEENLAALA